MNENRKYKNNGLELIEISSEAESFNEISKEKFNKLCSQHFQVKSFVVAWFDNKVLTGTWHDKVFHFCGNDTIDLTSDYKHVQRLRIFNQDKELLIWRSNVGHKGRLRVDDLSTNGKKGTKVVVAHQAIYGTKGETIDSFSTELSEERGTKIIIPFTNLKIDNKTNRIFIKTFNYLAYNSIFQAGYIDCRFVAFTNGRDDLQ